MVQSYFYTATHYITYFPHWFDMSPSVHSVLMYGFGFISRLYSLFISLLIHLQYIFNWGYVIWLLLSLKSSIPSLLSFRLFLTIFICFFESFRNELLSSPRKENFIRAVCNFLSQLSRPFSWHTCVLFLVFIFCGL